MKGSLPVNHSQGIVLTATGMEYCTDERPIGPFYDQSVIQQRVPQSDLDKRYAFFKRRAVGIVQEEDL